MKLIMTSAEGRQVPLGAACYPVVVFYVPGESCGASFTCCASSLCVTAFEPRNIT